MKAYLASGIAIAALDVHAQNCTVNVYVNHSAEMPLGMLFNATTQATRMFHEIGVNIRMRTSIPAHEIKGACGAPIVIEFENGSGYRGADGALAYSLPYKQSGTSIHVLAGRVRLDRGLSFAYTLLAHVMVHEITHVLEQIERHSGAGVMKAVWSDRDYDEMKRHPLPFAPEDVELIRKGLAIRASHAATELSNRACRLVPGFRRSLVPPACGRDRIAPTGRREI